MARAIEVDNSRRNSALEWWFGGGERFHSKYRFVEVLSVIAFAFVAGLLALDVGNALLRSPWTALLLVPALFAGLLAADLASGLVHWLADSYWRATTPFWGPKFVAPFREHHRDPLAITRHDFVEANCDNCLIAQLVLVPTWLFLPIGESVWATVIGAWVLFFANSVLLTSIAHGWAHRETPPAFARLLQRWGLVITPEQHAHHHGAPHKTHYCITTGWLNPLLDHTRFFRRLERVFDALGAPRAEHD